MQSLDSVSTTSILNSTNLVDANSNNSVNNQLSYNHNYKMNFRIFSGTTMKGTLRNCLSQAKVAWMILVVTLFSFGAYGHSDMLPPTTTSAVATSLTNIEVTFSVDITTVNSFSDFTSGDFTVTAAAIDGVDASIVHLTVSGISSTDFTSTDLDIAAGAVNDGTDDNVEILDLTVTDGIAPTFVSAAITSNTTIDITFSEDVSFVTDGDAFYGTVTGTGLTVSGATVSGSVVTLTVSPMAGDFDITDNSFGFGAEVTDGTNVLETAVSGENILDGIAPTFVSAAITSNTTIDITFSEDVGFVTDGDAFYGTVTGTGLTVSGATVSGSVVTLTVSTMAGDFDITDNSFGFGTEVTDGTNALETAVSGENILDGIAPELSSIELHSPASSPTNADALIYEFTFNEAVSNLTADDFSVTNTTAIVTTIADQTGGVYHVTVSGGDLASLDDIVAITLSISDVTDLSGNSLLSATPTGNNNNSYSVDNSVPANQDLILSADVASIVGGGSVTIGASAANGGDATDVVWLAPTGTVSFVDGAMITSTSGGATTILAPTTPGVYYLYVEDEAGNISGEGTYTVTVVSDNTSTIVGAGNEQTSVITDLPSLNGADGALVNNGGSENVIQVFSFDITDAGGDGLPTIINSLDLTITGDATQLKAVGIFEGTAGRGDATIAGAVTTVPMDIANITVAEGTTATIDVWVSFNDGAGALTDGEQFSFEISAVGYEGGSSTIPSVSGVESATTLNYNTIDVVASNLVVTDFDSDNIISVGNPFTITMEAQDVNENTDNDFNEAITVTLGSTNPGSSVLSGTTSTTPTLGIYTWSGLTVDKGGDYDFDFSGDGSDVAGPLTVTSSIIEAIANTSDVVADHTGYTGYIDYVSSTDSPIVFGGSSTVVGQFIVRDGGVAADADGRVTRITDLSIDLNTEAVSDVLALALFTSGGTQLGTEQSAASTVSFSSFVLNVEDAKDTTLVLKATFKQTNTITDGDQIVFTINTITDDTGGGRSGLVTNNPSGISTTTTHTGGNNTVDVIGSEIVFTNNDPSGLDFERNTEDLNFTVAAHDANGNLDTDENSELSISGLTGLSISTFDLVSGVATPVITVNDGAANQTITISDNDGVLNSLGDATAIAIDATATVVDIVDTMAPIVVTPTSDFSPSGSLVTPTNILTLQFNEEVAGVVGKQIVVYRTTPTFHSISINADDLNISSNSSGLLTINLPEFTKGSSEYTVNIPDGAFDDSPNAITPNPYVSDYTGDAWKFTTDVDGVPPIVTISENPVSKGTVAETSETSVSFDIKFNKEINNTTFDLEDIRIIPSDDLTIGGFDGDGTETADDANFGGSIILDRDGDNINYTVTINNIVSTTDMSTLGIELLANSLQDLDGNDFAGQVSGDFGFDQTAPIVTVTPLKTDDATPSFSGTINDNNASIIISIDGNDYDILTDGLISGTGPNWDWTLNDNVITPSLNEGTFNVIATATDVAGNVGVDLSNNELQVDLTKPSVTFSTASNPIAGTSFTITASFNEPVTVVEASDFNLSDGGLTVTGSGDSYTLTITPSDGTAKDITISLIANQVQDEAGNTNVLSSDFTVQYDNVGPILLSATDDNGVNSITLDFGEEMVVGNNTPADFSVSDATGVSYSVLGVSAVGNDLVLSMADYDASIGDLSITYTKTTSSYDDALGSSLLDFSTSIDKSMTGTVSLLENTTNTALGDVGSDIALYRSIVNPSANTPITITPTIVGSTIKIYKNAALGAGNLVATYTLVDPSVAPTVATLMAGQIDDWDTGTDDHGVFTFYITETAVNGTPSEGPSVKYSLAFLDDVTNTENKTVFAKEDALGTTLQVFDHPVNNNITFIGNGLADFDPNNAGVSSVRFVPIAAGSINSPHEIDIIWTNSVTGVSATFEAVETFVVNASISVFENTQNLNFCQGQGSTSIDLVDNPEGIDYEDSGNTSLPDFYGLEVYHIKNGVINTTATGGVLGTESMGDIAGTVISASPGINPTGPSSDIGWELDPTAFTDGVSDAIDTLLVVFLVTPNGDRTAPFKNSDEYIYIYPDPIITIQNVDSYYCVDNDEDINVTVNQFTFSGASNNGVKSVDNGFWIEKYSTSARSVIDNTYNYSDESPNGATASTDQTAFNIVDDMLPVGYYSVFFESNALTNAGCVTIASFDFEILSKPEIPSLVNDFSGHGGLDITDRYYLEYNEGDVFPDLTAVMALGADSVAWYNNANRTGEIESQNLSSGYTLEANKLFNTNTPNGGIDKTFYFTEFAHVDIMSSGFAGCQSNVQEIRAIIHELPLSPVLDLTGVSGIGTDLGRDSYIYEYCGVSADDDVIIDGASDVSDSRSYFVLVPESKDLSDTLRIASNSFKPSDFGITSGDTTIYIVHVQNDSTYLDGSAQFAGSISDSTMLSIAIYSVPLPVVIDDFDEIDKVADAYKFCSGATLTELQTPSLPGHDYVWSTASDGSIVVSNSSRADRDTELLYLDDPMAAKTTYDYYVENYTNSNSASGFIGCPSGTWQHVPVIVYAAPTSPTHTDFDICQDDDMVGDQFSLGGTIAGTDEPTVYNWYTSNPDGLSLNPFIDKSTSTIVEFSDINNFTNVDITLLSNGDATQVTTVYVTQLTDGLCESPSLPIEITVNKNPDLEIFDFGQPLGTLTTEFCYDESPDDSSDILYDVDIDTDDNGTVGIWEIDGDPTKIPVDGRFNIDDLYNELYGDNGLNGRGDENGGVTQSFVLSFSYTDLNTCTSEISETITVNPLPTLDIKYSGLTYDDYATSPELDNFAVCYEAGTITLEGIQDGVNAFSGTWGVTSAGIVNSGGSTSLDLATAASNEDVINGTEYGLPTDHTVTFDYTDAKACTNSVSIDLTINPRPELDIIYDSLGTYISLDNTSFCNVEDIYLLQGTYKEGNATDSVFATSSNSVWNSPTVPGLVTDANGTRTLVPRTAAFNIGETNPTGNDSNHNVTFSYEDSYGCTSSVTHNFDVIQLPTLDIDVSSYIEPGSESVEGEFCVTTTDVLLQGKIEGVDAPTSAISSYTLSSGAAITDNANGTVTFHPNLAHGLTDDYGIVGTQVGGASTEHTVYFTHTSDATGCANIDSVKVVVNPQPALALESNEVGFEDLNFALCESNIAFVIEAKDVAGIGGDAGAYYVNNISTPLQTGSITKALFNPLTWGENTAGEEITTLSGGTGIAADYTVRYEYDDDRGCSNSIEKVITLIDRPEMSMEIVGGCVDPDVDFYGTVDVNSNYTEDDVSYLWNWEWKYTGAPVALDASLGEVNNVKDLSKHFDLGDSTSAVFVAEVVGTYTFTTSSVNNTCSSLPFSDEVNVLISPTISFVWDSYVEGVPTIFEPNELRHNNDAIFDIGMVYEVGADTVWYEVGTDVTLDNGEGEFGSVSHTYTNAGSYDVSMIMATENNCRSSLQRTVNIVPVVTVDPEIGYFESFGGGFNSDTGGWFYETLADDAFYKTVEMNVDLGLRDQSWIFGEFDFETLQVTALDGETYVIGADDKPTNSNDNFMWATLGTSGDNTYRQGEDSWVYTPVFDISAMDKPMVSMNIIFDFESAKDGAVLQYYNIDDDKWELIGNVDDVTGLTQGIEWYDFGNVTADPGQQQVEDESLSRSQGWSGEDEDNEKTWKSSRHSLAVIPEAQRTNVQFRIAMAGTDDGIKTFGFAFDDFEIRERSKNVLLETFYSVSDDEGGETFNNDTNDLDEEIDDLLTDLNLKEGQIVISYHANFDNDIEDPFNIVNTADPAARKSWYGIDEVYSVLDGSVSSKSDDDDISITWGDRDLIISSLEDPGFNFEVTKDASADVGEIKGTVTFEVNNANGIAKGEELIAYVAIIEQSIDLEVGGITTHNNVLRKLLPDASGKFIKLSKDYEQKDLIPIGSIDDADGDEFTLDIHWNIANIVDASQLAAIVFIQNRLTKEVYQAEIITASDLNSLVGSKSALIEDILSVNDLSNSDMDFEMYPNPTDKAVTIKFNSTMTEEVSWVVFDQSGRVFDQGEATPGVDRFDLNTDRFPNGVYYVKMQGTSRDFGHKKLIILHR